MEIQTLLVEKKELTCQSCDIDFFGYSERPNEGNNDAPSLYECGECNALFSLSNAPFEEQTHEKFCPDCDAPLEETLEQRDPTGNCPMCGDRNFHGNIQSEDVEVETYRLSN